MTVTKDMPSRSTLSLFDVIPSLRTWAANSSGVANGPSRDVLRQRLADSTRLPAAELVPQDGPLLLCAREPWPREHREQERQQQRSRQAITPASFQRPMSSHEQPSSSSTSSVCAPASCARTAGRWAARRRTGPDSRIRAPCPSATATPAGSRSPAPADRSATSSGVWSGPQMHSDAPQDVDPFGARARREDVARSRRASSLACLPGAPRRRIALEQVLPPDGLGEVRPEALGLEHHEDDASCRPGTT